jgi:hypothetical protein
LLTKREENQKLFFGWNVLRTIYGPQEQVQFQNQKKPNSLNILGVMKSNRFRYAEHMIRRAEYLPKRARFKTMPEGRRKQGRRNLSGRMACTTIPGTMGLVIGQTSFKIEYNGGIFSDKP